MKIFLTILILILSFQSWTKADDIRDFEIEGMSVGDSLLDYFSEEEIKKAQKNNFSYLNKFIDFWAPIKLENTDAHDGVAVINKKNDSKYIIYGLTASKNLTNNFQECFQLKKNVVDEVSKLFVNAKKKDEGKEKHEADKTGKSFTYRTLFFIGKAYVEIACYDFYDKNPNNWFDEFRVSISSEEFRDFLNDEFYK